MLALCSTIALFTRDANARVRSCSTAPTCDAQATRAGISASANARARSCSTAPTCDALEPDPHACSASPTSAVPIHTLLPTHGKPPMKPTSRQVTSARPIHTLRAALLLPPGEPLEVCRPGAMTTLGPRLGNYVGRRPRRLRKLCTHMFQDGAAKVLAPSLLDNNVSVCYCIA